MSLIAKYRYVLVSAGIIMLFAVGYIFMFVLPDKNLVVLILVDGFSPDYLERYETPNLDRISQAGVSAEALSSVFPAKSTPNHYSIATGLYPKHHGIIANKMIDRESGKHFGQDPLASEDSTWWKGEPIWVTAERSGLRSAVHGYPGSLVNGRRPKDWVRYNNRSPESVRTEQVLKWINRVPIFRPQFIAATYEWVDRAGHVFGPFTKQTENEVKNTDHYMGLIWEAVQAKGGHLIILSDHGMESVNPDSVIYVDDYVHPKMLAHVSVSPILMSYADNPDSAFALLNNAHPHLNVYQHFPDEWHWGYESRTPDIVAVADSGWVIMEQRKNGKVLHRGDHGYDTRESYDSIFIAAGPSFNKGVQLQRFANIHVYSLLCHLLDIEPAPNDGSLSVTTPALKTRP